jgi:AmiR/NasT family two-component response regulator
MTNRSLRIAVADDEGFMRKYMQTILPRLGHEVIAVAETGRQLVEQCGQLQPDLVITDVSMPEMDGLDAAVAIYRARPLPIIVISGFHGPELIERTAVAHVMAYMVKPIKQSDLEPVITLAMRRFEQLQNLRDETVTLRDRLQEHEVVDRALEILMRWARHGKGEALTRLEQMANEQDLTVAEVAERIVTADEATDQEIQND